MVGVHWGASFIVFFVEWAVFVASFVNKTSYMEMFIAVFEFF